MKLVVFPDFEPAATANHSDKVILELLKSMRKNTGASFIKLSVFNYGSEAVPNIHYLTYPIEWLTKYVGRNFAGDDPFQTNDFRRIGHVDWRDLYSDGVPAEILKMFIDSGMGRNGISITIHTGDEVYCVVSFVFRTSDKYWGKQKRSNMDLYRWEANRLAEAYADLNAKRATKPIRLTARELDVLRNAALGKTDEQIALQLGIGKWTVVSHLQSAKYKLGCSNRTAAVVQAISSGLIALKINSQTTELANIQSPNSR